MTNFCRISSVLSKQTFHNQTSRLIWNKTETNFRRNVKIAKLSSSNAGVHNLCSQIRCRYTGSVVPLYQGLFSLYMEKINFISGRKFSTSSTLWLQIKTNQDKEKLRNNLFLGGVLLSVIFTLYMIWTMEYHHDYVYIEPDEKKK